LIDLLFHLLIVGCSVYVQRSSGHDDGRDPSRSDLSIFELPARVGPRM